MFLRTNARANASETMVFPVPPDNPARMNLGMCLDNSVYCLGT